uniref:PR domain zinc finger protein 1 n=2 Tax=Monopterus albus TaxID=43700 RepID=A0A3Q3QMI4_MONAL|nr:zinc finger protein 271-like isoform X1 [Monopterus albus]XP_020480997.1 zinc finger protein 271-like isoform X1 [Monopterus albus]XP_020480998.1 zinc finger protein 271-like isoform X1 [Monopterus albus]XP_020480999.1 zinc finger protein 271-like isoform X1 [Monopterus albus]XP_020481000.1 zinc finger protein 271-like isoform X1 [Monopterus albus]
MSDRNHGVEWVETTEEVVITEFLTPENNNIAVIPVLEPAESAIQKLLGTAGQGEDGFYCEECLTLFQNQSDPANINGPAFILDFPTSMGVSQRALLTLPYGLMIGRSSIPCAGVGVINHGAVVFPGMHFGPYEGEVTTSENAMASDFSWEIYKEKDEYEYIDAARESHSNWLRYVNFARNREEANLLAVQYKGSILFHCCRPIHPGDELLLWPSSKLLSHFSEAWNQVFFMKQKTAETNTTATSQIFLCPHHCQLSFTTEAFLQRHMEYAHTQPTKDCTTAATEEAEPRDHASTTDSGHSAASLVVLSVDPVKSKTCGECGKIFKQMPHLKRHKLSVHSNRRPYCCLQCRRTFSQASGLIRHQLIHRKQAVTKVSNQNRVLGEKKENLTQLSELCNTADPAVTENPQEPMDVTETECTSAGEAETSQFNCSGCSKSFTNEASLKKHKVRVHERLRPYVCTVCQKCFGQYNDLTRHLRCHQKEDKRKEKINLPEDPDIMPFSCAECSLTFSSVDTLQQHITEHHTEDTVPSDDDDDQSHDPTFIPQRSVTKTDETVEELPSQRPQRLGARSKISAITKLIAPKRRADICKKPLTSPDQTQPSCTEPETPAVRNGKLTKYKWFSCNRCKRTYGNPNDLKAHKCALRQHKCGQCAATFNKSAFLKRHEQMVHINAKSYSCDRCDKAFTTSGKLKQHQKSNVCMKYHCTSELFPCTHCQFSFTMKSYLNKHIKRHHPVEYLSLCDSDCLIDQPEEEEGEKKYTCPNCGKSCASAKSFKSHSCFQQVKVLYLCTDCGKGFTNHYGLKQHQRVHTGEKPYSCPHCAKSFSYTGQLNVHLRTHTGEKPYLCTHCGESFRQSGDLKRHEMKHTGVRPYSCPECCKSFSRPQSLKAHQMLHLGQRMFKCAQCGKSFSRNYHLRRHHQKMHL